MSAVSKQDLYRLIDQMPDEKLDTAFQILRSLFDHPSDEMIIDFFEKIQQLEPDDLELSETEREQFQCNEYISWDELKKECGVVT